jgi:hypothetical protein
MKRSKPPTFAAQRQPEFLVSIVTATEIDLVHFIVVQQVLHHGDGQRRSGRTPAVFQSLCDAALTQEIMQTQSSEDPAADSSTSIVVIRARHFLPRGA